MDYEHNDSSFMMEYMPHIASVGAVFGAIQFYNGHATAVLEALLTPIAYAIVFVFISFLAELLFKIIDLALDTENKRVGGAIVVIIIATAVAVKHVL